jgi:hypothetical protein
MSQSAFFGQRCEKVLKIFSTFSRLSASSIISIALLFTSRFAAEIARVWE